MRAWVTYRNGDWHTPSQSSLSPWYDGGTQSSYSAWPGYDYNTLSDTVTILNGHTINITNDVIVGDTGNVYNVAVQTSGTGGTGILNVSGSFITVQSNVKHGNATWNVVSTESKSAGIYFNSPSSIVWQVADAHGQTNAKLNIVGTTEKRILIDSISGSNGKFDSASKTISQLVMRYCDIYNVGDLNNNCAYPNISAGTNSIVSVKNTNFYGCGAFNVLGVATNTIFEMDTCIFTSSQQTYAFKISSQAASGTGYRYLTNSWFDKIFATSSFRDFTIYGVAYPGGTFLASTSNLQWYKYANNLVYGEDDITIPGNIYATDDWNYFHVHVLGDYVTNYHGPTMTTKDNITFAGVIFDPGHTDGAGDILSPGLQPYSYTIKNILVLPNISGIKVGKLLSVLGNDGTVYLENCTNATNGSNETGLIQWGETSKGSISGCLSLRSNISYSLSPWESGMHVQKATTSNGAGTVSVASGNSIVVGASTSFTTAFKPGEFINIAGDSASYQIELIINNTGLQLTSPYISNAGGAGKTYKPFVQDYIANSSYVACDYNAGWGLSDGTDGYGYNSDLSATNIFSYTPGPNDIVLSNDPFYDKTRNISTWAIYKGIATAEQSYDIQVSSAYDYIKASPSTSIKDLVDWVKDGWRVTNVALYNAGHSGQTIGALPYIAVSPTISVNYSTLMNSQFGIYLIKTK